MRVVTAAIGFACHLSLSACGQVNQYDQGYDEGYAEAEASSEQKIAALQSIVEEAQSDVSQLRGALDQAQASASQTTSEAATLYSDDWGHRGSGMQSSAEATESAIGEASEYLDGLESTLESY